MESICCGCNILPPFCLGVLREVVVMLGDATLNVDVSIINLSIDSHLNWWIIFYSCVSIIGDVNWIGLFLSWIEFINF